MQTNNDISTTNGCIWEHWNFQFEELLKKIFKKRNENKMKILVTGSSGFLGYAIRTYLTNIGYETYGSTRSQPPVDEREFRFDIVKDSCEKSFKKIVFDVIIHTIGLVEDNARFRDLKQTNVDGTKKILGYAKQTNCTHFIHLSSVSVYGIKALGQNRIENSVKIRPHSLISKYGRSKAQAELAVLKSEVPFTILRLPLIIGKGDRMVSSQLLELLTNGQLYYSGTGENLVSIMPVDNLCSLISLLIEKKASNRSFHCPSYHIPLNSFVNKYSSLTNLPFQIKKSPIWLFGGKANNIQKILLAYSWKGAHFQDSLIREFLPKYIDAISWEESIKEAVDRLYSTSKIIL